MTETQEASTDRRIGSAASLFSAAGLQEGDFAVDEKHGVGLFRGLTRLASPAPESEEAIEREYLVLEFEEGDKVYVPAEQADRVRRYVGRNGSAPTLSRLKGRGWARAVADAREQVKGVAAELAALYAERKSARSHAYCPDTPRQKKMEAAFPYEETPDQATVIEEVKRDLENPRPMDRLLIGDVGYGKTEVAVRAAFKVVQEGRQAAILCPTSVLASQHLTTFSERLKAFGVRVDALSRFRTPPEQQEVLDGLRTGEVQVVVGTHRLLSDDVAFQNLGLVIVDEEQRFGVRHKERLKQFRKSVDLLTMTATPIPRTLHMSLAGMRDVSQMNAPPEGRTPVETVVSEYSEGRIAEAIRAELGRGGQTYFLHNRVETIDTVADHLARIVPEARFGIAHGQMDEEALEEAMVDFYERRFDVLVCTTIIESGVDIPNANTLIVDDADQLGLAQLYQLRGRVGRSDRQAHALFLYKDSETLTDVARQRLVALREFSALGSGQNIALRDLELRGAGNLLGLEQSGSVAAVGLDLYLRMLESTVRRLQGKKSDARSVSLPPVELPLSSGVPADYIASERERLHLYERMGTITGKAEIQHLKGDLEKQYGPLPLSVENSLVLLRLRLRCKAGGVKEIGFDGAHVSLILRRGHLPPETLEPALRQCLPDTLDSVTTDRVVLRVPASEALTAACKAVETLADALAERRSRRRPPSGRAKK